MMNEITYIDPHEIKFLIHRDRDPEAFHYVKESIRSIGIQQPLKVRDISSWKPDKRRRPDGGHFKWEAQFGEGRTTAAIELYAETKDTRFRKVPAIIEDVSEGEIVGRFLSENLLRRNYTWLEQAKLVKADFDAGIPLDAIAKALFITSAHVGKLLSVLQRGSPKIEAELKKLTLKQAGELTSLPAAGQEIVIETLTEAGLDRSQLTAVVHKAREIADESGELSKTALKQSLKRTREDLDDVRQVLKLKRLHHSLGPVNLGELLEVKAFRTALDSYGINYKHFLENVK